MNTEKYEQNDTDEKLPHDWLYSDSPDEQVRTIILYYKGLYNGKNDQWLLGLYMAEQWLHYLNEPQHDLKELRLFVQTLESQRMNQGWCWRHLLICVDNWVSTIEQGKL